MRRMLGLAATLVIVGATVGHAGGVTKVVNLIGGQAKPKTQTGKTVVDLVKKFAPLAEKYKDGEYDAMGEFPPATSNDDAFANCYSAPGAPQVPSQCAGTSECGACFERAYGNLNEQRFRLCKLQRIYKSMMRVGKASLAFGDDASAVHGVAGLGWQLQGRKPIEESMASFQKTCEAKYEEIIGDLHGALLEVAACEAEFYGDEDWYNRFGFVYHSFMADSFRPDEY